MNYFFKELEISDLNYIGFDLDGTLYDELDFIIQPYQLISKLFHKENEVFVFMRSSWLKYGSSYNRIFSNAYELFELKEKTKQNDFIETTLHIFRNFQPVLTLSNRTKIVLEIFKKKYNLFLITDGNPILQEKKFFSLGLEKYFDKKNVVFTGNYTKEYHKPEIKSLELIKIKTNNSLFFGDREIDKEFANNANMRFVKVLNMIKI